MLQNSEVKGIMQLSLGVLEYVLDNNDGAVDWFEKAKRSYSVLGDRPRVEELATWINDLSGRN